MCRWLICLMMLSVAHADRVYFVLPDPSACEQEPCDGCPHCYNPYQYSEVNDATEEPVPSWPTQMDAPFLDELSR